jgi:hypothetical protein
MMEFEREQEAYKRLHQLEGENAGLRRENARLRKYCHDLEFETVRLSLHCNRFRRAAGALAVH